jgi:hypothetical protein
VSPGLSKGQVAVGRVGFDHRHDLGGSHSSVGWPMRSSGFTSGIGTRWGQAGAVIDVVHPSSAADCHELTSRITLSARSSQVLLLPTDEEGSASRPR